MEQEFGGGHNKLIDKVWKYEYEYSFMYSLGNVQFRRGVEISIKKHLSILLKTEKEYLLSLKIKPHKHNFWQKHFCQNEKSILHNNNLISP